MGKRELLIVLAFIVAGTVAFQFSAPPAKETQGGFSLSRMLQQARREMRGNQSYTAPPRTLTYAVGTDITELRVASSAGPLTIVGENRADVALELTVMSTGENEAAAIATANKTAIKEDRAGGVLTLAFDFPEEETQTSKAVLKVPARLAIRLDGNRETTVSHVRGVTFVSAARGTTQIDHVAERVSGEQNGGQITLASIGSVKMTLTRARGRISDVGGDLSLDVRDGDTEIAQSRGELLIETRRGDLTIRDHRGPVQVTGTDGQVRVFGATAEVRLDLRRVEVEAELASGVTSTLATSDEELRVSWRDPAGVQVDALASNGNVDAADWGLTPTKSSLDTRLDAPLGTKSAAAPRVSLRNQGANIVLKKSSKK
ncbi:MAG: hypothetical protein KA205_00745 [Acidobacteria bacterium]|jgi:hypothetical protein|nr:hypothetical protein [Acidobacteriota bacterium]